MTTLLEMPEQPQTIPSLNTPSLDTQRRTIRRSWSEEEREQRAETAAKMLKHLAMEFGVAG